MTTLLLCFFGCHCSSTSTVVCWLWTRFPFSVLQRIDDFFLRFKTLSRCNVPTCQKIIVQSTALVDGTQGRRGQMESYHFVEDFRIDTFDKDVWFEGSLCVFHRKGKIVSGSNILSIVQPPTRSIGTKPTLLVGFVVVVRYLLGMMCGAIEDDIGSAAGQRIRGNVC